MDLPQPNGKGFAGAEDNVAVFAVEEDVEASFDDGETFGEIEVVVPGRTRTVCREMDFVELAGAGRVFFRKRSW